MSESALIQRCRRGERDAQRELYERFAPRVYGLCLRLTGNPEDAFDVAQDAFVRALQNIASFDGRANFGTWLYRIATNEALQRLRRRRSEQAHLRVIADRRERSSESAPQSDRQELDDTLRGLSDEHRAILLLKYQEDLSYDEIATALGCALGTVASRLNRARAALRQILTESRRDGEETPLGRHRKV